MLVRHFGCRRCRRGGGGRVSVEAKLKSAQPQRLGLGVGSSLRVARRDHMLFFHAAGNLSPTTAYSGPTPLT